MHTLVSASFTSAIPKSAPGEIVYIPVGEHTITPMVNGKPKKITVKVPVERGEAITAALQSALDKRLQSTVRPALAFDHSRSGPAAGHPKAFSWDASRGVILSLDWSDSGRRSVEGGDYGYLSPSFLIGDNGEPVGLSDMGEIGSLVNEPAFRTIGLIAAADASEESPTNQPEKTNMNLIHATLGVDSAAAGADTLAVERIKELQVKAGKVEAAESALAAEKAASADLKSKLEAANTKIEAQAKQRAEDLVTAAVADGRILPKDEDTKEFYRDLIAAGNAKAEKALESLPQLNKDLDKPEVKAGAGVTKVAGEHAFETKAKALVTAKSAANIDEAFQMVAASEPAVYDDYRAQLA